MYRGDYKRMVREGEGKYGKVSTTYFMGRKKGPAIVCTIQCCWELRMKAGKSVHWI